MGRGKGGTCSRLTVTVPSHCAIQGLGFQAMAHHIYYLYFLPSSLFLSFFCIVDPLLLLTYPTQNGCKRICHIPIVVLSVSGRHFICLTSSLPSPPPILLYIRRHARDNSLNTQNGNLYKVKKD